MRKLVKFTDGDTLSSPRPLTTDLGIQSEPVCLDVRRVEALLRNTDLPEIFP